MLAAFTEGIIDYFENCEKSLTHFMSLVSFYTPDHWYISIPPENIRKPVFLMFLGGIERDQWHEMGKIIKTFVLLIEFFSSQNLFWFSWVLIKIFWSFKEKLY